MKVNQYEKAYACVKHAMESTKYVDDVISLLRNAAAPMSCKEIGIALFGDAYKRYPEMEVYDDNGWVRDRNKLSHNQDAQSLTASLSQVLSHLVQEQFAKLTKEKGEPFTFEREEEVNVVDDSVCMKMIDVWDANGNKYEIPNPNYQAGKLEWRMVTVTVTPTIKKYSLV